MAAHNAKSSNPALQALIDQAKTTISQQPTYTAPQIPITTSSTSVTDPYDRAAETASYASAKDSTGQAMQSAMKGLQANLASRGLIGSGVEAAALSNLYSTGLSQLGETDRGLAENAANRAFTANQSNTDRTIAQQEFNAGQQATAQSAAQSSWAAQLQALLSLAGLTRSAYA
jgi:hypothetical protein